MLFLADLAGWVVAHARQLIVGALLLIVILTSAIIYTRCTRQKPMSPAQIQKAQDAIAKQDREEIAKVLADADADVAVIDQSVVNAEAEREKAIAEAKKKYDGMSAEDLQAEAKRRVQEAQ